MHPAAVVSRRDVSVPTLLGAISGTLCAPPGATVVQVLVHGLTYSRDYWDFPYEPDIYSYVRRRTPRATRRSRSTDPGYRTTGPGTRELFHHLPDTDPAVIEVDERFKQTFTVAEVATAGAFLSGEASRQITVPTFTIIGSEDPFFRAHDLSDDAALAAAERPFFADGAVVEAHVVHGAGHDLNLERRAPEACAAILGFLARYAPAVSR